MNGYFLKKITGAWLITGTLDVSAACLNYFYKTGKPFTNVLKFIASGILGNSALNGGFEVSFLGLILHYFIALLFTLFYFILFYKIDKVLYSRFMTGLLYGFFIWATMFFIVLPLSSTPKMPFQLQSQIVAATILIACIGLPLSLFFDADSKQSHSFS